MTSSFNKDFSGSFRRFVILAAATALTATALTGCFQQAPEQTAASVNYVIRRHRIT